MLELQHKPLFHETEYALDVMLDQMQIDAASAMALRLYGDRQAINEIVDNPPTRDACLESYAEWNRHKNRAAVVLGRYGEDLISKMPLERQGSMASIALVHMDHVTRSVGEFLANWAVGDLVEGGYGEQFHRPPRAQRGTAMPYKKDWRRLHAPNWIRRYVKHSQDARGYREMCQRVARRVTSLDQASIGGGIDDFRAEFALANDRRCAYEKAEMDQARIRWAAEVPLGTVGDGCVVTLKPKYFGWARKRRHTQRKIARRGIATAETIVGRDKTAAFVRGESVVIEGINLDLAVKRRGSVTGTGHSAVALEALSKDGQRLADLCFYIDQTPAIDQLTAVALHLEAGAEDEIIKSANIIASTLAGLDHPSFEAKRSERAAEAVRWNAYPHIAPSFIEMAHERDQMYWQSTKHIWTESLGVFLLGHKVHKLMLLNNRGGDHAHGH